MNFSELEVVAAGLLEQKKRLQHVKDELSGIKLELKEQPRRSEKDRRFYELIGLDWEEPSDVKKKAVELEREQAEAQLAIRDAETKIRRGFAQGGIVVPLDPTPNKRGANWVFTYRSRASYPYAVGGLAELLGISQPMVVDNVTISSDNITVREDDPYYAKEAVVEAFEKARKTILLKLSPRTAGP